MENNELYLVFVKKINDSEYDLFFSDTPDVVWGVDWDVNVPNTLGDLTPDGSTYNKIVRIISPLKFTTIEEISCYSMEYAVNRIIALSWIDITNLEEYPDNEGRCVLHFGDTYEEVFEILKNLRPIIME